MRCHRGLLIWKLKYLKLDVIFFSPPPETQAQWIDVGKSKQSPFWFDAVLDGNTVYTVAGDKLSNLDEFFDDTLGVKPSSESILALDPNKKYCARVWLSASASGNPNGGNKQNQLLFQLN